MDDEYIAAMDKEYAGYIAAMDDEYNKAMEEEYNKATVMTEKDRLRIGTHNCTTCSAKQCNIDAGVSLAGDGECQYWTSRHLSPIEANRAKGTVTAPLPFKFCDTCAAKNVDTCLFASWANGTCDSYESDRQVIEKRAIELFGVDAQCDMAIEEMGELIKAILKLRRAKKFSGDIKSAANAVREEMADVTIMLEQLKIMYGNTSDIEREKLGRLERRMDGKE